LAAAVLLAVASLAVPQEKSPEAPKAEAPKAEAVQADAASQYAGSEMCAGCHEDIAKAFDKSAHHRITLKKQWTDNSCESCHGPGAKHAESAEAKDIRNLAKLTPSEVDKTCLTCHKNQPTQTGRIRGGHFRNEVPCTSCHTIHQEPAKVVSRGAAKINQQCASCHSGEWLAFQRPHAHRLAQNAMSCVDCHNPHGGFLPNSMRTVSANEPGCIKCHGDKRGPFTFEHAPVRLEGCATCHEPHGSANPRMLTRHEVRYQCLECHSNIGTSAGTIGGVPPAFHDTRSPRYRNCTVCHVKIHGSHVDRALLR
jgi:DmsE family decaheme c-type cytochrome